MNIINSNTMKRYALIIVLFASVFTFAQQRLTLEDIWIKYAFMPKGPQGFNAMNDGVHYTDIEEKDGSVTISKFQIKSSK